VVLGAGGGMTDVLSSTLNDPVNAVCSHLNMYVSSQAYSMYLMT
jgi:hypothetical protein